MKKRNNVLAWFMHIFDMDADDVRALCEFYAGQPKADYSIALSALLAMAED